MKQKQITLFVAAAISSLWAAGSAASGFQLLEANASGLGNAYAGSAAVAEDASTIFFNPAGMTKLQKNEVSLGFAAVNTSYEFSNTSSSTGALTSTGDGGNAGGLGLVPNAYYSYGINKDTFIGIGISAPFGLKTEYDSPWIGGAQAVLFDIKTANLNPSIAYRINEKVSIGGGFSYMKMDAEYQRLAAVSAAGAGTTVDLKADGGAWGWNIGAIFDVSKSTALGFSYRSSVKQELDGTLNFSGTLAGLAPSTTNGNASVDIKLPDTFIMSVKQQLNPKWVMLGDVSYTGWASIKTADIVRTSGSLSGQTVQTLDADFRDTWRIALGATGDLSPTWKIKYGIAYDQTPVQSAATRLVSLPDNDRWWFSLGAQWLPAKGHRLDFGATYLLIGDTEINNDQTAAGRGTVTGNYSGNAFILGAQYAVAF